MKIYELFKLIKYPVLLISILLIFGTFLSVSNLSFVKTGLWIFEKLNLRKEGNLATWFESMLFILCAISFVMLGWSRSPEIPEKFKLIFRLVALGLFFLSADEMVTIHEHLGVRIENQTGVFKETAIDHKGFAWVLLYGPAVVLTVAGFGFIYFRLMKNMGPFEKKLVRNYLLTALVSLPSIIVLEILEGFSWYLGQRSHILPCLEESFELITLCGFIACNTLIACDYDLKLSSFRKPGFREKFQEAEF